MFTCKLVRYFVENYHDYKIAKIVDDK